MSIGKKYFPAPWTTGFFALVLLGLAVGCAGVSSTTPVAGGGDADGVRPLNQPVAVVDGGARQGSVDQAEAPAAAQTPEAKPPATAPDSTPARQTPENAAPEKVAVAPAAPPAPPSAPDAPAKKPEPTPAPAKDAPAAPVAPAAAGAAAAKPAPAAPAADATVGLRLPAIIGDNMVLQIGRPLPFWGWAKAGSEVSVELRYAGPKRIALPPVSASATANEKGEWKAVVPALGEPAGSRYVVAVRAGDEEKRLENVVLGEVWLASGQSNMDWRLQSCIGGPEAAAAANYPQMRVFRVADYAAELEAQDDVNGEWVVCTPRSAPLFTGVGFFFARELMQKHKTPVGLIDSSWGGMPAQAYVSLEKLEKTAGLEGYAAAYAKARDAYAAAPAADRKAWEIKKKDFDEARKNISGFIENASPEAAGFPKADFDDAGWKTMTLPGLWERANVGLDGFDGVVWFRKSVKLPEAWVGRELVLNLGQIDDTDISYANGKEIGRINVYNQNRRYTIPAEANNAPELLVAFRCVDTGGGGGLHKGPVTLAPAEIAQDEAAVIDLAGEWKFSVEPGAPAAREPGPRPGDYRPSTPSVLYNSRIAPTVPFAVRGAIWYQGESNAGDWLRYRTLFPALIEDWRARWGYDFPFYWVQLANYMKRSPEPRDTNWAKLREAQTMTLALPATGQAVIIDIGESGDIHPRNKQDVGLRLALWARRDVFKEAVEPSSPIFRDLTVEGPRMTLTFDHAGGGLTVKEGQEPGAFAIAGEDGKFVWAKAEIAGPDRIVVSAEGVEKPVAVRYAWDDDPLANVYSKEGLPLTPFRHPIPDDRP